MRKLLLLLISLLFISACSKEEVVYQTDQEKLASTCLEELADPFNMEASATGVECYLDKDNIIIYYDYNNSWNKITFAKEKGTWVSIRMPVEKSDNTRKLCFRDKCVQASFNKDGDYLSSKIIQSVSS